jgi:hypothetical protein
MKIVSEMHHSGGQWLCTATTAPFMYIFTEKELRGLSPNFHIHVSSVSDLHIPRIGPCTVLYFPAAITFLVRFVSNFRNCVFAVWAREKEWVVADCKTHNWPGSHLSDWEVGCQAGLLALLAHNADSHASCLYHWYVVSAISWKKIESKRKF